MATRYIPNADEDPTYIGHRIVEGKDFSYSIPVFSDKKKNKMYEDMVKAETRKIEVDVLVEKKDMRAGVEPSIIVKERQR